jgi:XTP/dITP diphosphohydrolase
MSVRLGPVGLDRIVLGTTNEGKARELERLLGGTVRAVETLREHAGVALPPETGLDYRANALAKARAVWNALGVPAVGDDSGLEVDALAGAPGLRSARYAGEKATDAENNAKLLEALAGVPERQRTARFRCALVLMRGDDEVLEAEGACEGAIVLAPRGDHGFGYDPLFLPEGETYTFAELPAARKDSISHRARAAAVLARAIRVGD